MASTSSLVTALWRLTFTALTADRWLGLFLCFGGGMLLGVAGPGHARRAAVAFDTRIGEPRLPGSAARAAEKQPRRLGSRLMHQTWLHEQLAGWRRVKKARPRCRIRVPSFEA